MVVVLSATCRVMDRADCNVQMLLTITVVHGLKEVLFLKRRGQGHEYDILH
jgi:hypothetical protein